MPEEQQGYKQSRTYEIIVRIKELEYTADLISLRIVASLSTGYDIVTLTFSVDPDDMILEDVFGGEPIKLTINQMGDDNVPLDGLEFELMVLESDLPMFERVVDDNQAQRTRVSIPFTAVDRNAYKTVSSIVNGVYLGQNLNSIVSDLLSQTNTGLRLRFDSNGRNNEVIDQVCIPPTTFYNIIKEYDKTDLYPFNGFLDRRFGLFNGVPAVYVQGQYVYIKNLSAKLKQNQAYTVYQLNAGSKNTDDIIERSTDGKTFYTYDQINTKYAGNAKLGALGSTINHIDKPSKTLFTTVRNDLETIAQNNSLTFQGGKLFRDSAIQRTRYIFTDTGFEENPQLKYQSHYGRSMGDISSINFRMERALPLLNLLKVGECVKFKPENVVYAEFGGKYILYSTSLEFARRGGWSSVATVNLVRTNRKI
jgi:hypothetical protein